MLVSPIEKPSKKAGKKAAANVTTPQPRVDINGWVLCPGDAVLIVDPKGEHHGLFAKVDAFPTTLELSSYVQIDGRPSASGRVLMPNAMLRWMGPDPDRLDLHRPTAPGQRVRVVLEDEALASPALKALEGQLGLLSYWYQREEIWYGMVEFENRAHETQEVPIKALLTIPTPVVHYVPEPEATPAPVATEGLAEFRNIPLEQIQVTRNTRQVFDENSLAELAQSIKERGVIAPITVRLNPYSDHLNQAFYELVAGERRLRASKLAGLDTIPAMVRVLDDRAFIEVQLLENLQRQDVRPSDEAVAFAELLNKHNFSAEEIALKVGKPVKFVLQRAKLVALVPFWLEALHEDKITLVAAHDLARLPAHSQVAVRKVIDSNYSYAWKNGIDTNTILRIIDSAVMRKLASAVFPLDDATLHLSAGACTTCVKRSSCNAKLFDDESFEGNDQCLDSGCHATKVGLFVERRLLELTKEDGRPPVLLANDEKVRKERGGMRTYDFNVGKQKDKDSMRALYLDGPQAGLDCWGKPYPHATPATAKDKEAEREKRRQELRQGRIKDNYRLLLTAHIAKAITATGEVPTGLLTSYLDDELRTQGGPHATLTAFLVEHFGFKQPDKTEMGANADYKKRSAWVNGNVQALSNAQQLGLYFGMLTYNSGSWSDKQERFAKLLGGDTKAIAKEAEALEDAKKGGAKK